jgi:cell division protein FtsL
LGALLLVISLAQVNQFSRLTSTGYEIDELERVRAEKQAENHELESDVARLSSLARVELVARLEMGMVPATRQVHIRVNQPLPEERELPTRYLPPAVSEDAVPPAGGGSIWDSIRDLFPF